MCIYIYMCYVMCILIGTISSEYLSSKFEGLRTIYCIGAPISCVPHVIRAYNLRLIH